MLYICSMYIFHATYSLYSPCGHKESAATFTLFSFWYDVYLCGFLHDIKYLKVIYQIGPLFPTGLKCQLYLTYIIIYLVFILVYMMCIYIYIIKEGNCIYLVLISLIFVAFQILEKQIPFSFISKFFFAFILIFFFFNINLFILIGG